MVNPMNTNKDAASTATRQTPVPGLANNRTNKARASSADDLEDDDLDLEADTDLELDDLDDEEADLDAEDEDDEDTLLEADADEMEEEDEDDSILADSKSSGGKAKGGNF